MLELTPGYLLANPELVEPIAPWCVVMENLELGMLLLAQPWFASAGLRRAELERQLARLAADMPIGATYFQRISRGVAALERRGALRSTGSGRNRSFLITAEGFAALILNLSYLCADPTIDGSEFELKRALVAMWNVVLGQFLELPSEIQSLAEGDDFFAAVESINIWGQPVITDQVISEAFSIEGLIAMQRLRVRGLRDGAVSRLQQTMAQADMLSSASLAGLPEGHLREIADRPETLALLRNLATRTMPELRCRATIIRYDNYLAYLDGLNELYSAEFGGVDINRLRQLLAG